MRLIWSVDAQSDMRNIRHYVGSENPRAALTISDHIIESVHVLMHFPYVGRNGEVENTREFVLTKFPYTIIYMIESELVILRVLHTARSWPPEEE